MKRGLFFGLFLLCLLLSPAIAVAEEADIFHSSSLILKTGLNGAVDLEREPGAVVDFVTANISFFPFSNI